MGRSLGIQVAYYWLHQQRPVNAGNDDLRTAGCCGRTRAGRIKRFALGMVNRFVPVGVFNVAIGSDNRLYRHLAGF